MSRVIHVQPEFGYKYFTQNTERLAEELVEIASDSKSDTSVYMTEENGDLLLYVYQKDKRVFQRNCRNSYEARVGMQDIYERYLPVVQAVEATDGADQSQDIDDEGDESEMKTDLDAMSDEEFEKYMEEREAVIAAAVYDMIEVLTEDSIGALEVDQADDGCLDNIVDHIVEHLAIKCGLRIRRPMVVSDDDSGKFVRTEYPYEEYDFSEEELNS